MVLDEVEKLYPGLRETIAHWKAMELPACPRCRSPYTARVSAGLVGRSMHLAGATHKIRLIPNGHPADFYCNSCKRYFDSWGQTVNVGGLLITVNRPEKWIGDTVACFVQVENPRKKALPFYLGNFRLFDGDGRRYEVDDRENESKGLFVAVTQIARRTMLQGYVPFALAKGAYPAKVIHGHAGAPTAVWEG
jgi:hypothetical protein